MCGGAGLLVGSWITSVRRSWVAHVGSWITSVRRGWVAHVGSWITSVRRGWGAHVGSWIIISCVEGLGCSCRELAYYCEEGLG